jgi:hypothetical protein
MRNAEAGIAALAQYVDTLLVIPNENLFRVATDKTTFAEAFVVADQVLYSGIACLVDLIVEEGLINLDLADVKAVLSGMGAAMMGTGEASGEQRAIAAAEEAIVNPLLDDVRLKGARSLLLSITGGRDLTLWEVDEAANRVRQEVDPEANIIVGATLDESLDDRIRVSIVASGMPAPAAVQPDADAEAPVWTPRFLDGATTDDEFGRRLTEAISERDPQAKARASQKGRGRDRRAPGDAARRRDGPPKVPSQPPVVRSRKNSGAKKSALSDEVQFQPLQNDIRQAGDGLRELRTPVAEDAGTVGWPEHWARAGEVGGREQEPSPTVVPLRQPGPPVRQLVPPARQIESPVRPVETTALQREPPVRQAEPSARKNRLLQRLADLVGNRREA